MKKLAINIILMLSTSLLWAQEYVPEGVSQLTSSYVNSARNRGLMVAVIDGDQIQYYGFGELAKGSNQVPNKNTVFEIGELSSLFTTTLLSDLVLNNEVHLDDRLQDFLTDTIKVPTFQNIICTTRPAAWYDYDDQNAYEPAIIRTACGPDPNTPPTCITLCNLASHSAALPELPKGLKRKGNNPFAGYEMSTMLSRLEKLDLKQRPGEYYKRSDFGIALLGEALSHQQGMDFEALAIKRLFTPLDMQDTRITLNAAQLDRLAKAHNKKGKVVDYWSYGALAPAGGFRSTAKDLARFVQANMGATKTSLEFAFDATHQSWLTVEGKGADKTDMTLGWFIKSPNTKASKIWLSGSTGGFSSFIGFLKHEKKGIIILSNSSNSVAELGQDLLAWLKNYTTVTEISQN
ncbi:MAG: serine hydrolase [Bacteroidota bacterium]